MSGKQYGGDASVSDLDTTPAGRRGAPAKVSATAGGAVMEPPAAPEKRGPGDYSRRGGSGGFVPSETAKGTDLVRDIGGPQTQATRTFWLGTLPTCPKAVVHLGGQDFPDFCDPEVKILGGQTRRAYQLGRLARLTQSQVDRIREGMARRFIRWSGDGRGDIYCIPTQDDIKLMEKAQRPVEHPQRGDDWLARHVYMIETDHRGDEYPPSAYETGVK